MAPSERIIDEGLERQLIEGLCRNDRDSVAAIYDAYGGIAYGLAFRLLGRAPEAEDVVQEAFLTLWRQAWRLDASRGIRMYLLAIVHNKAIDRLRQGRRRPEVVLDPDAPFAEPRDGPEEVVTRKAEGESVRAALVDLPKEQRVTLELTYFGGLTTNEVALRMRVPLGTVKSRLRLALRHLRERLSSK